MPSVIVSACRTAIGSFNGALRSLTAPQLGAVAIREAVRRASVSPEEIDEVIMGCVLPAALGQSPARQAALGAGLPTNVGVLTINKVCGSGLKSVMLADQSIRVGDALIVVAGGMENMSRAPYYLTKAREGYRMGHGELIDGMIHDGLWDPYNNFHMGNAAEMCATKCEFSREQQDQFAAESYRRAVEAQKKGYFQEEIVAVEIAQRKADPLIVNQDEEPGRGNIAKLAQLRPAFIKEGSVTAGNASSLNDGAAALVVVDESLAKKRSMQPLAKISGSATHSQEPEWFTTAPTQAIKKVLNKLNLKTSDIDLYEINEAFACVTMAATTELGLDMKKVNICGGAVALGHPIGASGARILTTLLYALKRTGGRRGLATLCIGGGEAVAVVIERV